METPKFPQNPFQPTPLDADADHKQKVQEDLLREKQKADLARLERLAVNDDFKWFMTYVLGGERKIQHDKALNLNLTEAERNRAATEHWALNSLAVNTEEMLIRLRASMVQPKTESEP